MIIGPSLKDVRERAKTLVMERFVLLAERDGTPPTLRALYVMKAAEARVVLAGGSSTMIAEEAQLRGKTSQELAETIVAMAEESAQMEVARMRINVRIEQASTEIEIMEIVESIGLVFTMKI